MTLAKINKKLSKDLSKLSFGQPVTHVYDPFDYAWGNHEQYLDRFGEGTGRILLLGMNPGPWGMAQTGVPFGEVAHVRDWMKLNGKIKKPKDEHPKRPIDGLQCKRAEVSGARLWGWAKERFQTPEAFFKRFFVINYCPLSFMEAGGKNRTPDKLPIEERKPLLEICDGALQKSLELLQPSLLIGVGTWAEACFKRVAPDTPRGRILHPSPASPIANRGWAPQAEKQLADLGIELP